MEIILLEEVTNLGKFGQIVNVASGYGRNYLLPQGKAIAVNAQNRAYFESQKQELEKKSQDKLSGLEKIAASLKDISLTIAAKTSSSEGKLYGSVSSQDIVNHLSKEHKITLNKKSISVPDTHIRQIGEYTIKISLDNQLLLNIPLKVIAI